MFVASLFTVAKKWKQPTCPSWAERINKLWYRHTMEYYSSKKRNVVLTAWMNLENIILRESQTKRVTYTVKSFT